MKKVLIKSNSYRHIEDNKTIGNIFNTFGTKKRKKQRKKIPTLKCQTLIRTMDSHYHPTPKGTQDIKENISKIE